MENREEKIKSIAESIEAIISSEINKQTNDDNKYKNHYEDVMSELEAEIKECTETIEDFKESKLNINAIEQEGYLRALKTMVNKFRHWELYI